MTARVTRDVKHSSPAHGNRAMANNSTTTDNIKTNDTTTARGATVIGIIGEALMDMMLETNGTLYPMVGGSPFNVARALGRLRAPSCYLSPLSRDAFGDQLTAALLLEGVLLNDDFRSDKPTSLAVVSKNDQGQPSYSLYRDGVADRDFTAQALLANLPQGVQVIHTGSLAIVPEEVEKIRDILTVARGRGILISIDINMRPGVVADTAGYVAAVKSLLPLSDLVKASDEDLMLLGLDGCPEQQCEQLLSHMNGGLAIITLGSEGAIALSSTGLVRCAGLNVSNVVDTVGAGDCFQAGLLASLFASGYLTSELLPKTSLDVLAKALRQGCAAAAINITRKGCQPPSKTELDALLEQQI